MLQASARAGCRQSPIAPAPVRVGCRRTLAVLAAPASPSFTWASCTYGADRRPCWPRSLQLLVGCTGPVSASATPRFYGLAGLHGLPHHAGRTTALSLILTLPAGGGRRRVRGARRSAPCRCSTRGFFFLMVTLAFGQMMFFVLPRHQARRRHRRRLPGPARCIAVFGLAAALHVGAQRTAAPSTIVSLVPAGACISASSRACLRSAVRPRARQASASTEHAHAGAGLQHLSLQARRPSPSRGMLAGVAGHM